MPNLLDGGVLPLEVEIELTNWCNASCIVCPRADMPTQGRLKLQTLDRILKVFAEMRKDVESRLGSAGVMLPRITVAGGGEPFLHSDAIDVLSRVRAVTANLHVITNGSALVGERMSELIALRPASIACSFWGIAREEYERAMGLPYERTLARVCVLADAAKSAGIPFEITWVRIPEILSSDEEIRAFWARLGVPCAQRGAAPWNRANALRRDQLDGLMPESVLPDPSRHIWCSEIAFSVAFDWRGDCKLCCCGYFGRTSITLGSVLTDNWATLAGRKRAILLSRPLPDSCRNCRLPRRSQMEWLAGPVLDRLGEEERATLLQ